MAWEYINYDYATAYLFQKILLWTDKNCNIYLAIKLNSDDSWSYYAGNGSHALETGNILTAYATEALAITNYLTTSRDANGKILCVFPNIIQAKYIRLYIESGATVAVYEFTPSTYFTAHEIISGELHITDQLSAAPLIRVSKSSVDRIKIGNLYGGAYGIAGFDSLAASIFELSSSRNHIAGWDFNASQLTKNDTIISSNGIIRVGSGENSVILNSQDTDYRLWIGHSSAASAPFRVTKLGKMFAEKVSITGTLDADYIKRGVVVATYIYVTKISDLSGNLGNITAGDIKGITITGVTFQTNDTDATKLVISTDGITLHVTSAIGKYSDLKYGDGTKYGSGALAYIHHTAHKIPFYVSAEQDVADFHFYNRSAKPTGAAEVGDVCVVNGILMVCTSGGTPGAFTCAASVT